MNPVISMTYLKSTCLIGACLASWVLPQAGFAFWFLPGFMDTDLKEARTEVFLESSNTPPETAQIDQGDSIPSQESEISDENQTLAIAQEATDAPVQPQEVEQISIQVAAVAWGQTKTPWSMRK